MKWSLLVFIKNKVCMYLFKTRKTWNVIYWQCFLKAFENWNGKLLRFFWSSHLRSSVKKGILKISQNSQESTCVGVSILINLHASSLQLYQKKETPTQVFSCEFSEIFKNPFFFRTRRDNCFWILQMKIKLLKTKFLIDGFTVLKFHIRIILLSNKYQKACK